VTAPTTTASGTPPPTTAPVSSPSPAPSARPPTPPCTPLSSGSATPWASPGSLLRITEPGFDSYAVVRQQGEVLWTENSHTHASFSIGLYARDPRIWSMLERSFADLYFPTISGGLVWPATWPATWTGVVVSGSRQLFNPGNLPVGLQLRVDGPAETVQVVFPETGEQLNLENPDGNLLEAGQWLDIDTANHQVLLNGDAGRRSWAYGDWLLLPPATETALAISGTGTTTDSKVSGTYRAPRI
jgi:hypothetical protein